jgi:anhydro-N-acetylmuramic acid kinase
MSGSSLDGIDIAYCEFVYSDSVLVEWELGATACYKIPENVKEGIQQYTRLNPKEFMLLERSFTAVCKQAVEEFLVDHPVTIDFIGIHGQTLFHYPDKGLSFQMGDGKYLQYQLGLPVVADFRKEDILEGGQGTPMAPLADKYLFSGYDVYVNLGGIANITYWENESCIAYDLFPFNQYFNYYANLEGMDYDKDGTIGRSGNRQKSLDELFHSFSYFDMESPKSLDNNWIHNDFISRVEESGHSLKDKMNSYYHFCVEHLMYKLADHSKNIFISGGGAYNTFFIELLAKACEKVGVRVVIPESKLVDYKEAALIAFAASCKFLNRSNFIAAATGAKKSVIGGTIYR